MNDDPGVPPGTDPATPTPWPTDEVMAALAPARLFGLDGRVVVITGAAGGVGRWLAAGFAAAGARLLVTDRDAPPLEELAAGLRRAGSTVELLVFDLAAPDAPDSIVGAAVGRFGRLDVLVNNAGVNRRLPILEVEPEMLDWIWATNFRAPYLLAQAAARVMIEQGGGAILQVGSINSTVGIEDLSLYAPTKAALGQLTRVAAVEWARHGIRVNTVVPGFFATPMNATHWAHETRAPWIMDRIPLCRPGDPPELVGVCLLLASDAGSYITGQAFVVDGGFTAGSRWNVPQGTGLGAYREHSGFGRPPVGSEDREPAGPEDREPAGPEPR